MPDDKTTGITPAATTTGRTAADDTAARNRADSAAPEGYPVTSTGPADATNPGPHNPDAHGPQHGATKDTEAQKLADEAAAGKENRY